MSERREPGIPANSERTMVKEELLAVAKEMNSKGCHLLSCVQVPADGCQFFIQSAHLHGLE